MNNLLRFLFTILFSSVSLWIDAQLVFTYDDENAFQDEDVKAYVEEVKLYSNYTYVTIAIKPKHYISRLNIWTSPYTYLQAGTKRLKYLGVLSKDEKSYHTIEYDEGYGWNDASSYKRYTYTLVFEGSPNDNVEYISVEDPGISYRGYCFRNIKIFEENELPDPIDDDTYSDDVWEKYIAYTTKEVNMRKGPSLQSDVDIVLPQGAVLFVDKTQEENEFYRVLHIDSDREGYVSKKYINFQKKVTKSKGDMFVPTKQSGYSYTQPSVKIYNNTKLDMTLNLNGTNYKFKPNEKRTISLKAQSYDFRVSAPGVIPLVGTKTLKYGYDYDWEFYIKTVYR